LRATTISGGVWSSHRRAIPLRARKGPISITPLRRVQTCWMPRPTARHRTISRPRFWPCWRRTMSVPT
jgi:hypothetical protein